MDSVVTSLIETWGPFGALLVVAGYTIYKLATKLIQYMEERLKESQANTERFLVALQAAKDAQVANTAAITALGELVKVKGH